VLAQTVAGEILANRLIQGLAIYHVTANNKILRRTYAEFADRARGFAYYLKKHGFKRVGILAANTPAFLEALFGAGAAGAVNIGQSYHFLSNHTDTECGLQRSIID
jgi:acyl-CoA synthetase (AMP-forming)/AMP-acid ligase II